MDNMIQSQITDVDVLLKWSGPDLSDDIGISELPPVARKAAVHLSELQLDGVTSPLTNSSWSLGFDQIDCIGDDIKDILGIPRPTKLQSHVYTPSSGGTKSTTLSLDIRHAEVGVLSRYPRRAPFFDLGNGRLVLPETGIRELEAHLHQGPQDGEYESPVASKQAYLAESKRLASAAGAAVEPWLDREEFEFPDSIGLNMAGDLSQGLELKPTAEGIENEAINERLHNSRGNKSVVWTGEGRQRKRVILKPAQREALLELSRSGSRIEPEDIADFLDTPEAFLPPGFDLSDFSDRVKGLKIRVYDSRPYVHVRREKLKWIPDISIDLQSTDENQHEGRVKRPPSLSSAEYKEKVANATREGRTSFIHDGAVIRFGPATDESLDQLRNIAGPDLDQGISGSRCYILDIFENIDALEFSIDPEEGAEADDDLVRDIQEFDLPGCLDATMRPFQIVGYNWLRTLDKRGHSGLLADDMGLGKTLQVISHLAAMHELDRVSPSLAIVPKTLIENWFQEIQKFCPNLRVAQFQGGSIPDSSVFDGVDLVLTTYETLRRNQVDLAKIDWSVVICDEAQAIKNPTTGRTTAVKSLKSHTRIAMTGTPVENGLSELWSIMDWVQPGLLRSRLEFRREFERPIVEANDEESRRQYVRGLQEKVLNHYLRRMKVEVLEGLAEKHIHRIDVPLSLQQMEHYGRLVESARHGGRGAMLSCLQQLLRLCACPWDDNEAYSVEGSPDDIEQCPKLGVVLETLDAIQAKEEKALIFVDRIAAQALLQNVIRRRYGIPVDLINGKITEGRQAIVDRFNAMNGFQVMILSPKVGGTGLNITSANHVIHYMRPWNPAIENQATDRVYRIGQERDVHVYLPIATWIDGSEKSVEEVLDELIQSKTELATDVIVPTARMSLDKEVMGRIFTD